MDLSVIVVNYNVKHFLEQCLHSVQVALKHIQGEVIIIDNNSVDGSVAMIRRKFPGFTLIENHENAGFSKANNQGIRKARGTYILLLNPDTIVQEDSFSKCLKFMEDHPDAGAMGVKMIDGQGHFLPESKRGFPTPAVAFYKMFGLSRLFPGSSRFNRYHLGHLDPDKTNEVDILPGAFICIRKHILDQLGGLDEDYFMYGEDVDLSYRIRKKGFKNYYYPGTTIIHFKGESTRKGTLNYVAMFYKAMAIFAAKHFSNPKARLYTAAIMGAIYFRAFLSGLKRIIRSMILPLLDMTGIFFGYLLLIHFWGIYKFSAEGGYPPLFTNIIAPIYTMVWVSGILCFSGYQRPYRIPPVLKGLLASSAFLLLVYALLPLDLRFSRALIILGSVWAMIITSLWRYIFRLVHWPFIPVYNKNRKRILVVAGPEETKRILHLFEIIGLHPRFTGSVDPGAGSGSPESLGTLRQLPELITFYRIDEIIFSAEDISVEKIIYFMTRLANFKVQFKIAPPESMSVIGSSSRFHPGELYFQEANPVTSLGNQRTKRFLDVVTAVGLLVISPFIISLVKEKKGFYTNTCHVMQGSKTWVGPQELQQSPESENGFFKPSVLSPAAENPVALDEPELVRKIEMNYVQNYRYQNDLRIVFRCFRNLGQNRSGN